MRVYDFAETVVEIVVEFVVEETVVGNLVPVVVVIVVETAETVVADVERAMVSGGGV